MIRTGEAVVPKDDELEKSYVGFDGDRIGDRIVRALICNDEQSLAQFVQSVQKGLSCLQQCLIADQYRIVLATGDGQIAYGRNDPVLFRRLALEFSELTGATMSVGIGTDLRSCYLAMKFAKSLGTGHVASMRENGPCLL